MLLWFWIYGTRSRKIALLPLFGKPKPTVTWSRTFFPRLAPGFVYLLHLPLFYCFVCGSCEWLLWFWFKNTHETCSNTESKFELKYHLSGDNLVYRFHPAPHGFAFDSLQKQAEFLQQLRISLKVIAVIVHPVTYNIQNSDQINKGKTNSASTKIERIYLKWRNLI